MKRTIAALLLCVMLLFSVSVYADSAAASDEVENENLTVENCPDLAELLTLKDEFDPKIKIFMRTYIAKTIEFDGNIAALSNHDSDTTRYDMLIYAGDYSETSVSGPCFQFADVNLQDMGIDGIVLPDYIFVGSNVHIIARVGFYDSETGLFRLGPISVAEREVVEPETIEPEPDPALANYNTLQKGDKGDEVKALQQRLIDLKYLNDTADGSYGKKTQSAVERFQSKNSLTETGIADPATQALLFSDDAEENSLTISCASVVIGSYAQTAWYVDGQEFTLTGNKTKKVKTQWGTYLFDALGNSEKISD